MDGLRSKLFQDDSRLAACLVDNAQHVTPGSQGAHVSRIQCAVLMLGGGFIEGTELLARRYGATTAKAVLNYKTARGIINKSYQTVADDIVGIMTLRRLDAEMTLAELKDARAGVRL